MLKLRDVTVEPVLFFYMMVIFLEMNALQELIRVKSCLEIINPENTTYCYAKDNTRNNTDVEQQKAYWIRFNGAILFLFTFLSTFYVASWTDKFGRKLPMLIPPIGTIIAASINCVLSSYIYTNIAYILISSAISGLTFGSVGIIASTFGFISDISDESSRTKRIVILEAMIYIGGTIGIYIAGAIVKLSTYNLALNGFSILFLVEICITAFVTLYVIIRIPNRSCNTIELSKVSCSNLFHLQHVKDAVTAVFRPRDAGKRKTVLLLLIALFLIYFGLVVQFTLAYYVVNRVLHWEFSKYSNFNSLQFAAEGSSLLIGLPVFLHLMKMPDHLFAAVGIISKMAGYIVFGLSNSDILTYSCIAWFMFSEYPVPAIRSILSKTVDVDEKGRIFAFTTMLQNFCFLVGSVTFTTIYENTFTVFPGLSFVIAACLQAVALIIIIYLYFTSGEIITTYEVMENDDGSIEEIRSVVRSSGSVNADN